MASDGSVKISAEFDTAQAVASMRGFAKTAKGGLDIVGKIGKITMGALAGVEAGFIAAGAVGVKYNAKIEQYMASFKTLLGDQEKAFAHMEDLKEFASKTPFEMPGIADASRTLLSFGVENENVMSVLKQLGDVSLGNQEKFSALALVYGQVSSQGKLMGQDLIQCINAGFNPLQVISEHTGQSMAELKEQMSQGAISAEMVAQAFAWATEEGGMFHDGLQKQSEIFDGLMSTLKDDATALMGEVVKPISESMTKELLPAAISTIDQMMEAYQKDGLDGLANAAGAAFSEVITKAGSYAPKMIDVAISFLKAFVNGIKNNKGEIKEAAAELAKTLMEELIDLLPKSLREPLRKAIVEIEKAFRSEGVKRSGEYIVEIFRQIGNISLKVGKTALPVFAKALKFCTDNMDVLLPLAVAYFTTMKAHTILKAASNSITAVGTAWKAAAAAVAAHEKAQRLNMATTLGGTTLMETAVALFTGKIELATAAQWAWNAAMNASPFAIVSTAIGLLVGGVSVLTTILNRTKTSTDELKESNDLLAESYTGIGEAATKFRSDVQEADSILSQFNDTIIVSSEKQQEIADTMDSIQKQITQITGTYAQERKNLTESEIAELDRLFEKMHEQAAQELELQQAYQTATTERARILAETHQGTAEAYAESSKSILRTAEDTRVNVIAKAEEQLNEELALLQLRRDREADFSQQRYEEEAAAAQQRYDSAIEAANKEFGDTNAIIANGYAERTVALEKANERTAQLREEELLENESYNARKAELLAQQQEVLDSTSLNSYEKQMKMAELSNEYVKLRDGHERELADINKKMSGSMSEEAQKQAGTLMEMSANASLYGGELTDKTDTTVKNVIEAIESLPGPAKEAAVDAMNGMLEGMEEREPVLYSKAQSIADNIISILRHAFDEHSPSKVTKKIFHYVMDGGIIGLEDREDAMYSKVREIASKVRKMFQINPEELQNAVGRMQGAVRSRMEVMQLDTVYRKDEPEKPIEDDRTAEYRKMAEIFAEAVADALDGTEFTVDKREFARLITEVG